MTLKRKILFNLVKFHRYILRRKFISVFGGPLKGYQWTTSFTYDYIIGDYMDPVATKFFDSWLSARTVFYDVGANIGYYSLIANKKIVQGRIYAFEPVPHNMGIFREHMRRNRKHIINENIELMPYAISDAEKEVYFSDNKNSEGNTYVDSEFPGVSEKKLKVKCHSIDDLVEQGFRAPDIIKMDVEGAEMDVLKGAVHALRRFRPMIILATHDCHIPGVQQQCVDFLMKLGYDLTKLPTHNKHVKGLDDYIAIHKERNSG